MSNIYLVVLRILTIFVLSISLTIKTLNTMAYKWRPSASQRRAFAERMADPDEQAAYNQRKQDKADKRRAGSSFDYNNAGGNYVPTQGQYDAAMIALQSLDLTNEQQDACNQVISGYSCKDKIHHDYIHIVNELRRSNSLAM